jgi:hypothetical protein
MRNANTPSAIRLLLAGAAAAVIAGSLSWTTVPAAAQEDTIDTRIMRGLLNSLGLRDGTEPGIDYHERSPLVVPPTRDLPPPQTGAAAANPAWPKDPDVTKRREAKRAVIRNTGEAEQEEMRQLRPDELRSRGRSAATGSTPATTGTTRQEQLMPSQLGHKGFQWTNPKSWFDREGTVVPFVEEPARTSLTEPPAGLRTPSPKFEYGSKGRLEPTRENKPDQAVGKE